MSTNAPYFASGLAVALLSIMVSLRTQRPADLTRQCPPAKSLAAAPLAPQTHHTERSAQAPVKDPAKPSARGFDRMPDGAPVPPLPADAPKKVRLGVALFRYAGAEGASPRERSHEAAKSLAEEAYAAAKEGFRRAIAKGDPGSNEDIGWVQRGVLEKRVEREVFELKVGELGTGPIETPRGFWVAKRTK
jgi:hypothetical protein